MCVDSLNGRKPQTDRHMRYLFYYLLGLIFDLFEIATENDHYQELTKQLSDVQRNLNFLDNVSSFVCLKSLKMQ